jgi:penicillin-binding protein 1A
MGAKALRLFFWSWFLVILPLALICSGGYVALTTEMPDISTLKNYRPPVVTTVYADDDRKIAEFYEQRRFVVPLSRMPRRLIQAFVAAEDARFFDHEGVDLFGILRAAFKNLEAGEVVQGASTITQQVARSFFLSAERSYRRKLEEAVLAYRIDRNFTKEEILFLYLNQIYLGYGAYGVAAAADSYFGKALADLTLAETATLAGLPPAPSTYSPAHYPERAKKRRWYVLRRMLSEGYITEYEANRADVAPVAVRPRKNWYLDKAPYYAEHVRRYVEERYGADALYRQGLQIYTAVDLDLQEAARAAVDKGLRSLDKRQGFRGPLTTLIPEERKDFLTRLGNTHPAGFPAPGMIVRGMVLGKAGGGTGYRVTLGPVEGELSPREMRWSRTRLSPGDVVLVKLLRDADNTGGWELALEQTPVVEGALVCVETQTGAVKAMVGGRDFTRSQFNRAVQSHRQPGSSFKPIIYAAALDKQYTPLTVLSDTPFFYNDGHTAWAPVNYDHRFLGPIRLRKAISKSRNIPVIRVLKDIGVDYAVDYAHRLGITSPLDPNLSLALGASGVSLMEMLTAYSVFANGGKLLQPRFITRIIGRDGRELDPPGGEPRQAIDASTAYIMTSLLESVVQEGTGRRVRALDRPVAGKTGTTNDFRDAWFMGYTPHLVAGTWVGFDQEQPLGRAETGSRAAIPIWLDFMAGAVADHPPTPFSAPESVVFAEIDRHTGLRASADGPHTFTECFKPGTVPTVPARLVSKSLPSDPERSPIHQRPRPPLITTSEDFFKSGI